MTDASYGVVVASADKENFGYLLVQQRDGHWGFPKGHPEGDESAVETARRELFEEVGIAQVRLIGSDEPMFWSNYTFRHNNQTVRKTVGFFLALVTDKNIAIRPGEILAARWVSINEAKTLLFANEHHVIDEAQAYLLANRARL